ncbi:hypothetical protein H696_05206 [Fonticula alba]|uniref:N-acetyltransferase domain-containing protein n=1 Tax=Fonticula alba TaxID=691883 RepID=A0A058Z428_FONAL|nr:hypothetical protein H696_05206 [Fonticula alba]KCV68287.1 hypothetical protein H696_05206 [Fonticula alba]|eukprot:XP_009497341.1 hypothetical protein H696_05206 [Fonticula alba]
MQNLDLPLDNVTKGVAAVFENSARGFYLVAELHSDEGKTDGTSPETSNGLALAGCLLITTEWSDWWNAEYWWIQSTFVLPQFRGQRIFTSLYEHLTGLARTLNTTPGAEDGETRLRVSEIRLYVEKQNDARFVYDRLGFQDSGYLMMSLSLRD